MEKSPLESAIHNGEQRIRISKKQEFASTPKQYLKMKRNCFKHYCESSIGYDEDEVRILLRIFDMEIKESNIMRFINRKSSELYLALINNKIPLLEDNLNTIYIKGKKKPKKRDLNKTEALLNQD